MILELKLQKIQNCISITEINLGTLWSWYIIVSNNSGNYIYNPFNIKIIKFKIYNLNKIFHFTFLMEGSHLWGNPPDRHFRDPIWAPSCLKPLLLRAKDRGGNPVKHEACKLPTNEAHHIDFLGTWYGPTCAWNLFGLEPRTEGHACHQNYPGNDRASSLMISEQDVILFVK